MRRGSSTLLIAVSVLAAAVGVPAAAGTEDLQQAIEHYRAGRLDLAAGIALRLVSGNSSGDGGAASPRAWVVVALVREAQGDPAGAADAWRAFLPACRTDALRRYAAEALARCRRRQEDTAADKPNVAPVDERLERLAAVADREFVESSEHFVVRCRNAELAPLLLARAERALRCIQGWIVGGAEYPHMVELNVYATADELHALVGACRHGESGAFELRVGEDGSMRRVVHLVQLDGRGRFDAGLLAGALPHELCHLVVAEWFGDADCPLWLQEGLAMLAESTDQSGRIVLAARVALAGEGPSLAELLACAERPRGEAAELFYAQAYSLASYLHDRLSPLAFGQLLEHLRGGCTMSDALGRTLAAPGTHDLMQRLERAWADDLIEQGQVLSALGAADGAPARRGSLSEEPTAQRNDGSPGG